jgi:hypothetical protein
VTEDRRPRHGAPDYRADVRPIPSAAALPADEDTARFEPPRPSFDPSWPPRREAPAAEPAAVDAWAGEGEPPGYPAEQVSWDGQGAIPRQRTDEPGGWFDGTGEEGSSPYARGDDEVYNDAYGVDDQGNVNGDGYAAQNDAYPHGADGYGTPGDTYENHADGYGNPGDSYENHADGYGIQGDGYEAQGDGYGDAYQTPHDATYAQDNAAYGEHADTYGQGSSAYAALGNPYAPAPEDDAWADRPGDSTDTRLAAGETALFASRWNDPQNGRPAADPGTENLIDLSSPLEFTGTRAEPRSHRGERRRRAGIVALAAAGVFLAGGAGYLALRPSSSSQPTAADVATSAPAATTDPTPEAPPATIGTTPPSAAASPVSSSPSASTAPATTEATTAPRTTAPAAADPTTPQARPTTAGPAPTKTLAPTPPPHR